MKHFKTIKDIQTILPKSKGIEASILYGSYARKDSIGNSDLDIKLIINKDFNVTNFIGLLKNEFKSNIEFILYVELRKKIVIYYKELPKLEFGLCNELNDIKRDFLGSEINDLENIILYEREKTVTNLETFLTELLELKISKFDENYTNSLINKFIYEFESSSSKHKRSDGYQFYYFHNIALHLAVQLRYLSTGKTSFHFLPKNFLTNEIGNENADNLYNANASLFLPNGNKRKRALLDFFYIAIKSLVSKSRFQEIQEFCEHIYQRDFFWNFRDANKFNTKIKKGLIHRTSALALYQDVKELDVFLEDNNIKTIIDLRADRELKEINYSEKILNKVDYIIANFDPWNQPEWFIQDFNKGTNHEIAYRFFTMGCKYSVKKVFETILNQKNGNIAIHCHAGKDRTGIIFSMIHLLLDSPKEDLYTDYLSSEMDVTENKINIALDYIKESGGIEPYLLSCGLQKEQISRLKIKLSN